MDHLIDEGLLTLGERVAVLKAALDDRHLFAGIGEIGTDSVFQRSFSVLVVPMVLGSDLGAGELPEDMVLWALDRVLVYAQAERDWRGYVADKGWAHATASAISSIRVPTNTLMCKQPSSLRANLGMALLPNDLIGRLSAGASRLT